MNKIAFLIVMALASNGSATALSCNIDRSIHDGLDRVHNLAKTTTIWPGYDLYQFPIFIYDSQRSSQCALDIKGPSIKDILLETPIKLTTNGVYEFLSADRIGTEVKDPESIKLFQSLNDQNAKAIILDQSAIATNVGIAQLMTVVGGSEVLNLHVLIHEGFHFLSQRWQVGLPWPEWTDHLSERNIDLCYSANEVVGDLYKQELTAIKTAFTASNGYDTIAEARKALQNFRTLRDQRYTELRRLGTMVNSKDCPTVEAAQEMIEGVADFVAIASLLDSGFYVPGRVLKYIEVSAPLNPTYYALGSLQLLTLRALQKEGFSSVLAALSAGSSPSSGIFTQVKAYIDNLPR